MDNAGEEERYLKSLLANFRNGLLSLKDDLLTGGKPLVEFPRIWMIALSKSDLLPEMDVYRFRDLLVDKACDEIDELRKVLGGLVEAGDALAAGEDFVLLSSAKFNADQIVVTERIGLQLILPLAAMLPFERHVRWARARALPAKVVENLLGGAESLAVGLVGRRSTLPGPVGRLLNFVGPDVVNDAIQLAGEKLRAFNSEALAKKEYLAATLSGFRIDLDRGEEGKILLRSRR